jgi:hypothetical protein
MKRPFMLLRHVNELLKRWCSDYLIQRWKLFPTNFANKTWEDVQPTRRLMAWAAAAFGFVALLLGLFGFGDPLDSLHPIKVLQAALLAIWILGPPVWFWYEFFYLYKRARNPEEWDRFKHGQEQSGKIWLALVTVLFGLYFGKHFRTEYEKPANGQTSAPLRPQQQTEPASNAHPAKPPAGKTY